MDVRPYLPKVLQAMVPGRAEARVVEMGLPEGTKSVWAQLAATNGRPPLEVLDPESLVSLPAPAQRWLKRVLPAGTPLCDTVQLSMAGEIKIGSRWMPFTAQQILRAGVGFVWKPVVGRRLMRFIGADILGPGLARTEFRLHGLVPVVRATGPDVARSGAGRLAAETVAWLPQATTPQAGARWTSHDDNTATVTLQAAGEAIDLKLTVAADGRLQGLELQRWNTDTDPPGPRPFGAEVNSEYRLDGGVRIAGSGPVGWDYGTLG